jgi:DHA3 family macrolide efflux protein-like MFS transporter
MQTESIILDKTMPVEKPESMRDFWVVFTGQAFSLLGSRLVQFSIVWWLTSTTGSASVLAFTSIMALLPQVLISPFAGALIDRWDRRKVMMAVDTVNALAVVMLAVLFAGGSVQFWHIYALMFVRAVGGAFQWPAMQASTSLMVPREQLSRVAGLNQALMGLSAIVAPPLGALLIDVLPMESILAIDVGTAMLAIALLMFIRIPQPENGDSGKSSGGFSRVLEDMREGFRFVAGWKGLLIIMGIAMIFNLLTVPAMSLTPILVTDHFAGGSKEYALLEAAIGIGMVAGGLLLGAWGGFKTGAIVMGIGVGLVGLAPGNLFPMALGGMALAGLMNPIVNGSMFALLQDKVPPEMQGRVFTLMMSSTAAMAPLGLAVAGPFAEVIGIQAWFVAGGVVIILMSAAAFFVPSVRKLERARHLRPGSHLYRSPPIAQGSARAWNTV